MKKILVLFIAVLSVSAAFSQNRDMNRRSNSSQSANVRNSNDRYNNGGYSDNHGNNQGNYGYNQQDRRFDDRNRQVEIARVNRDYDQRIYQYRNDRSINSYERDRRIRQAEYERSQKIKSFGSGVVVGALATLILGAIFSH